MVLSFCLFLISDERDARAWPRHQSTKTYAESETQTSQQNFNRTSYGRNPTGQCQIIYNPVQSSMACSFQRTNEIEYNKF